MQMNIFLLFYGFGADGGGGGGGDGTTTFAGTEGVGVACVFRLCLFLLPLYFCSL